MTLKEAIAFIRDYKSTHASADKAAVQAAFVDFCRPSRARSVWVCDDFSFRFSQASGTGFSNTVLGLSALKKHDDRPFIVVLVRQNNVQFLLANSTFLKKISHSSHKLRIDNEKGSFNGTDIMLEYEGIANTPENFDTLFAQHMAFTWKENLERLVEATNAIVGYDRRFLPTESQVETLINSPIRAFDALSDPAFKTVETELSNRVTSLRSEILNAAVVDNVNLRGNAIEQLLTGDCNAHELGDLEYNIGGNKRLVIDIKTKLLDSASAPKAYNIDKMLSFLSEPGSVFAFFMVGVSIHEQRVFSRLLPIFDSALLDATGVQHHWAGRVSRGVTQLSGRLGPASDPAYLPSIDLERSKMFLEKLLAL